MYCDYSSRGIKNAEIASALTLTEQTIKNYLRRIYNKLGVRYPCRSGAQAMKQNLVPFDEQTLLNDDFPD
ncbi:MAG: helix-turn-helix transcriptional regulator [Chloroflexota bacterium]